MGGFTTDASGVLCSYLQDRLNETPGLEFQEAARQVLPESVRTMRRRGISGVSVWLFDVGFDEASRTLPRARTETAPFATVPASRLQYLMSAVGESALIEMRILETAIDALHAHPVFASSELAGTNLLEAGLSLQVVRRSLTISEQADIWRALRCPWQPSACFEIRFGVR